MRLVVPSKLKGQCPKKPILHLPQTLTYTVYISIRSQLDIAKDALASHAHAGFLPEYLGFFTRGEPVCTNDVATRGSMRPYALRDRKL